LMRQRFNPTMVRLLLSDAFCAFSLLACFNPTMVRLLPVDEANNIVLVFSFNPTMVRLLQPYDNQISVYISEFQSHNGAIAALRTHRTFVAALNSFNPTMVRLLLEPQGLP